MHDPTHTTASSADTTVVQRASSVYRYAFGEHLGELTLTEMRARLTEMMIREVPDFAYSEECIDVGGVPAIRVAAGSNRVDRAPGVIVWFHGGGYVLGNSRSTIGLAASLARTVGCDVVIPDYRLAPEAPFPAAVDDATSAARWAISTYGADSTILGGDSAGGGLVMSVLFGLRDEGPVLPRAAILASPLVDLTVTAPSLLTNGPSDVAISARSLKALAASYLQGHPPEDPRASPVFGDLLGLPPILIQVADDEALVDDSTKLAMRLSEVGVAAELSIYSDVCHAWQLFAASMPQAQEAIVAMADFARRHTG